jgi:lipopolysaccharide/colanic/teichoic acid biosynthesis glycosyltransferase
MSLIGPRPEMCEYARRFELQFPGYRDRHIVKPGITGWAQVQLKRNLDPSDAPVVLAYDLFYVEHASLVLDGIIFFKTATEFLSHRAV